MIFGAIWTEWSDEKTTASMYTRPLEESNLNTCTVCASKPCLRLITAPELYWMRLENAGW